jgi:2-polyprenyl-3-methyl-5-hydroxy-6-metoxy-1,4-benzoquinol methylase
VTTKTSLYAAKQDGYYGAARLDLLRLLPKGLTGRLLEVGAGSGSTIAAAKELGIAAYAVAIDIHPPSQPQPCIDLYLTGDIETLASDLDPGSFDIIVCGDVLEHLVDPWTTTRLLGRALRSRGALVSSIPNFRNFRALAEIILRGSFSYQEAGLLDETHLRFFCRTDIGRLFEGAGLLIERMDENMGAYGIRHRAFDRLTLRLLHEFFVFQYLTLATKP